MATTSQTEIGTNTKNDGKRYSYAAGIAGVPFASFLRIYKYSYDEGMANVASQQNDVQGALQNSGLLKNITDGVADTAQFAYGDKDPNFITGIYSASFAISEYEPLLRNEIVTAASATFTETWGANDDSYGILTGSLIVNANVRSSFANSPNRILATIINLKSKYFNINLKSELKLKIYLLCSTLATT